MSASLHNSELEASAAIFAALADPTRLLLVRRLSSGRPLSITQLAAGTHITRQGVTKHLHVMSHAGLVKGARQGRQQLWELNPDQVVHARRCLDRIARDWEDALQRLKSFVEE